MSKISNKLRQCLLINVNVMKRVVKNSSSKEKSSRNLIGNNERITRSLASKAKEESPEGNTGIKQEKEAESTESVLRKELRDNQESLENKTDIKQEDRVDSTDVEEKSSKINLASFEFKGKKRPVLEGSSSKKRQHVKVEYDDLKIKKEEVEDVEPENQVEVNDGKPLNWRAMLNNIRKMRENKDAPVDSMGCHKCPDENESPKVLHPSLLFTFLLSQGFLDTKISITDRPNVEQSNKRTNYIHCNDSSKGTWMYCRKYFKHNG